MQSQSHTPEYVSILPRDRTHDIGASLARDWFDNHPFKTAWFNAMSITFPLGEKFFIDSVRHYAGRITDPKLQAEIRGFCGQEGFHRREHDRYNQALCRLRGYDRDYLEGRLERNIARAKKFLSPIEQLAVTAALEHITAIMAESALSPDSPMMGSVDPAMQDLWDWHAAEEMEHKAVAFDVYRAAGGTEKMRMRALRRATWFLFVDIMGGVIHMLRRDGKLWRPSVWRDGWKFLFDRGGILRRVWPAYRAYFREGYHPWQRDTRQLLDQWKQGQGELAAVAAG
ncbi:MAG: metal-dependent hydrolase [Gammaproteobacteria bacterium]|jgi:predicted metal-dependent hydrolase|nr:metal-dependent hydrolase [Gammaproteobacteria bacterium]MDH5172620.1 metal-dependent hydrolase [Gammaproteobacteria bacterium]